VENCWPPGDSHSEWLVRAALENKLTVTGTSARAKETYLEGERQEEEGGQRFPSSAENSTGERGAVDFGILFRRCGKNNRQGRSSRGGEGGVNWVRN